MIGFIHIHLVESIGRLDCLGDIILGSNLRELAGVTLDTETRHEVETMVILERFVIREHILLRPTQSGGMLILRFRNLAGQQ